MAAQQGTLTGTICDSAVVQSCQTLRLAVELPVQSMFDPLVSGQYWGLAFTSVIFLYLFSKGIGLILTMVKHG
jgi:hypothetical protein